MQTESPKPVDLKSQNAGQSAYKAPPTTLSELILNTLIAFMIITQWIFAGVSMEKLPSTIPVHFDFTEMPTLGGSKAEIFILPSISTFFTIVLQAISLKPQTFKLTGVKVNGQNAAKVFIGVRMFLRYVNTIIVGTCLYDLVGWVRSVERYEEFGPWTWIASIIGVGFAILVSLIIFLRYSKN